MENKPVSPITSLVEALKKMSFTERNLNVAINKSYAGDGKRKKVFLDELDPLAGRYETEPSISCGAVCEIDFNHSEREINGFGSEL
jgi:hypothetical protein